MNPPQHLSCQQEHAGMSPSSNIQRVCGNASAETEGNLVLVLVCGALIQEPSSPEQVSFGRLSLQRNSKGPNHLHPRCSGRLL